MRRWFAPTAPNAVPDSTDTPASASSRSAACGTGEPRAGDVREDVERALGHQAAHTVDRVQSLDDQVATNPELGDHRLDGVLRPGQRLRRRNLLVRARPRDRVDQEAFERLGEGLGHDRVAHPPAGHRVRLREPVQHDGPCGHAGQAADRDVLAAIQDPAVDLVGENDEIMLDRGVGDALEIGARQHAAGRVGGRVQDDHPGARRDQAGELVRIEAEVVLLAKRHRGSASRRRTGSSIRMSGTQDPGR